MMTTYGLGYCANYTILQYYHPFSVYIFSVYIFLVHKPTSKSTCGCAVLVHLVSKALDIHEILYKKVYKYINKLYCWFWWGYFEHCDGRRVRIGCCCDAAGLWWWEVNWWWIGYVCCKTHWWWWICHDVRRMRYILPEKLVIE